MPETRLPEHVASVAPSGLGQLVTSGSSGCGLTGQELSAEFRRCRRPGSRAGDEDDGCEVEGGVLAL